MERRRGGDHRQHGALSRAHRTLRRPVAAVATVTAEAPGTAGGAGWPDTGHAQVTIAAVVAGVTAGADAAGSTLGPVSAGAADTAQATACAGTAVPAGTAVATLATGATDTGGAGTT